MGSDYEKPKRSWREIDQKKDQSPHRKENRPGMNPNKQVRAENASKLYKAQLDNLFNGTGKVPTALKEKFAALETSEEGVARKDAAQKIMDAKSSAARDSAVEEYLKKWELPADYNLLAEVLACSDEELQEMALDEIAKMVEANRVPKRTSILEQRLKSLVSLADDEDIQEKAQRLLKQLRVFK